MYLHSCVLMPPTLLSILIFIFNSFHPIEYVAFLFRYCSYMDGNLSIPVQHQHIWTASLTISAFSQKTSDAFMSLSKSTDIYSWLTSIWKQQVSGEGRQLDRAVFVGLYI